LSFVASLVGLKASVCLDSNQECIYCSGTTDGKVGLGSIRSVHYYEWNGFCVGLLIFNF